MDWKAVYSSALFYYISCFPSCTQASPGVIRLFTEVCSQTWRASVIKPQGRQEYRKFFFSSSLIQDSDGKKRKSSNWNEGILQINTCPQVILLQSQRMCKHGNRLLIWVSLTSSGCVQLRYRPTAAAENLQWEIKENCLKEKQHYMEKLQTFSKMYNCI